MCTVEGPVKGGELTCLCIPEGDRHSWTVFCSRFAWMKWHVVSGGVHEDRAVKVQLRHAMWMDVLL